MIHKLLALCAVLLLLSDSAMAMDTYPDYDISDVAAMVYEVYIQPNGDLILDGTGIDAGEVDYPSDGMVARVTPDGELVWGHHFRYAGEEGIGSLSEMADDMYMMIRYETLTDRTKAFHYFDAEKGFIGQSEPMEGQYYPADKFMIGVDERQGNTQRIRWLDFDGNEIQHYDHESGLSRSYAYVIAGADCIFIWDVPYVEQGTIRLTKVGEDLKALWQNEYRAEGGVHYFVADEEGGIYALSKYGVSRDEIHVVRIDADGSLSWRDTVAVEEGRAIWNINEDQRLRLLFQEGDRLKVIRYGLDSNRIEEVRSLPLSEHEGSCYHIEGMTFAPDGTEYVFGRDYRDDFEEYYGAVLLKLNTLRPITE